VILLLKIYILKNIYKELTVAKGDQLLIYVRKDLKRRGRAKAILEDTSLSAVISKWLSLWLEGNLPTPNVNKSENEKKNNENVGV
jgi:hypothetical protein